MEPHQRETEMSSKLQLASIMAPANEGYWWYYGQTAAQVGQLLKQNKATLTDINAYVDTDNTVKFTVVMEPVTEQWWWYYGQTAAQVGQLLTQNKAQLTDISAYIDTDHQLKFAVIMRPGTGTGWYYGCTGQQVGQHLEQSKSRLATISAYVDSDNTVKFAFAMVPADQTWWWYFGETAAQVGKLLTQNKAMLTDISAYVDTDNTVKFVVVMAPANQTWWWYFGDPAFIGQQLTQNKARMVTMSPYMLSTSGSITIDTYPNISGLNGTANLTIEESGAYSFSGGWSPSNWGTGLASQNVAYTLAIRDIRGKVFIFTTSGEVPTEGSYNFNNKGTNASIAQDWQFLSEGYTWHDSYSANIDIGSSLEGIVQGAVNWFNQNQQTIDDVVQVVGDVTGIVVAVLA
jgi:hypothetical protein